MYLLYYCVLYWLDKPNMLPTKVLKRFMWKTCAPSSNLNRDIVMFSLMNVFNCDVFPTGYCFCPELKSSNTTTWCQRTGRVSLDVSCSYTEMSPMPRSRATLHIRVQSGIAFLSYKIRSVSAASLHGRVCCSVVPAPGPKQNYINQC